MRWMVRSGKPTPARYAALQWFDDLEKKPPHEMLFRKPPSAKMRRLMADEKQVARIPIGAFSADRWVLTYAGREALALKGKRRLGHENERAPDAAGHQDVADGTRHGGADRS